MFCYQCEQTEHGTGCIVLGKCGKTPETAALQDLLIHVAKTIAAMPAVLSDEVTSGFLERALFTTVTNVSFDPAQIETMIREGNAVLVAAGATPVVSTTAGREELLTMAQRVLDAALKRTGFKQDALIEVLHSAQNTFGFLTPELLWYVAGQLKLPPEKVVTGRGIERWLA